MLKPHNRAEIAFDIDYEIGHEGKNSKTYVIKDQQLNAQLVAKQIEKKKIGNRDEFFDESRKLYLSAHTNVVQIHYACEDPDHVYLVMPHYARGSLKSKITGNLMTVREIIVAACQILAGLHNIHSKRLIHFDVKPDNVLMSDRGEALLSDFGQAKAMNFGGQAEQDRLYMKILPPEAFRAGAAFDRTFDIYQFGLTLYRMCNGDEDFYRQFDAYGAHPNFDRLKFRSDVESAKFPDRSKFLAHIPMKLRQVIKRCMSVKPEDRYQSALEVANELAGIEGALLDWKCERLAASTVWTKNKNGTKWTLTLDDTGASTCVKQKDGGKKTNVTEGCRAAMSTAEVRKFLGER